MTMELFVAADPALEPGTIPADSALRLLTSGLALHAILGRGIAITSAFLSLVRFRVETS